MTPGPQHVGATPGRASTPAITPALMSAAQRAVAADELGTNRVRIRTAYAIATFLTGAFVVADVATELFWPDETDLTTALVVRAVSTSLIGGAALRLRRTEVSERELDFWVNVLCPFLLVTVALLALCVEGVDSPYLTAACLVTTGYAFVPRRATKVVFSGIASVLLFPATFAVASLVWDRARVEMQSPRAWFDLLTATTCLAATIAVLAAAAHMLWALRREVFAARSIGRYRTEARIGRGGMGEVWSAYDETLRRRVALKIMHLDAPDPVALARFEREIRATTELTHPNTVRVLDFGITDDGLSYYAMELLEGEPLSALLRREGALPVARAVHLASQAARALAEAHARGIVHRDVKPENLFVTCPGGERDFLRVLDFGIARLEKSEPGSTLTRTGTVAGTPHYLAPEVIGGADAGPTADVYALGVVLYQMLAGHFPYGDVEGPAMLVAHVLEPHTPLGKHGEYDPVLEGIVDRCLAKKPEDRFADAGALADALAAAPIQAAASEGGRRAEPPSDRVEGERAEREREGAPTQPARVRSHA